MVSAAQVRLKFGLVKKKGCDNIIFNYSINGVISNKPMNPTMHRKAHSCKQFFLGSEYKRDETKANRVERLFTMYHTVCVGI